MTSLESLSANGVTFGGQGFNIWIWGMSPFSLLPEGTNEVQRGMWIISYYTVTAVQDMRVWGFWHILKGRQQQDTSPDSNRHK